MSKPQSAGAAIVGNPCVGCRSTVTTAAQHRGRVLCMRCGRVFKERRGQSFADYGELWRWSVDDLPGFWSSIWEPTPTPTKV